ncbi:MAG: sigma-70 family RNA polymerase sigma factor [Clostridia bacterium]|nr:sigma-70 family RNA polymerase sigma factor [Clostridia bacterium]
MFMRKVVINGIDTKNLPKINQTECEELLKKTKEGDKQAQDQLVIANLRLVLSMVQRFSGRANSDDLFQVGVVGLMKAIEGFDPKFNVRFSTYAVPMISGEMRRLIKDSTGIKVSRSMRDTAYRALRAKEEYELKHSTSPTMLEIAAEIDVPLKDVVCALDAVSETVSLQECVYNDGEDGLLLMEQLGDSKQSEENWSTNLALREAISQLPEREKEVLNLRYYVGKTQMEISQKIGISQAQVSRLEKNALGKIKECL